MGLSRSLTAGASSLKSQQQRFDVISNNVANANTIGFKSSRVNFSDQLSQTLRYGFAPDEYGEVGVGGMNPVQYGLGVKVGSITRDMTQGAIEVTSRPLDMSLNGDGMFVFNFNGQTLFSRAGSVDRDVEGFLVDTSTGAFMQGYNVQQDSFGKSIKDNSGKNVLSRQIGNVRIPADVISEPKQTQTINFGGNLDRAMQNGEARDASIKIFDNSGGVKYINITFERTVVPGVFNMVGKIDGKPVEGSLPMKQELKFNSDGTLNTPSEIEIKAADLNDALSDGVASEIKPFDDDPDNPKNITIVFGDQDNLITGSITNFSGASTITASRQDGYEAGNLVGLSVDPQGKILGEFTNQQLELLGQIILAKFTNAEGLLNKGNNFYTTTPNSGFPNYGTAGESFRSTSVAGQSLEQSNVELTREFTDMIQTQRAFEAASRIVTVSDQMLAEVNQLKR
jgi:flagellar hook protein FlgE